jgi:hypothetical protein
MTHGSMPVSRSSGSGGGGYSLSSTRTYVDNSSNRSLGRVGMSYGRMPVSRSSGSGAEGYSSSSTRTYVDNSFHATMSHPYSSKAPIHSIIHIMFRHFFSPEMKVLLLYIFINNIEDHLSSTLTKCGKISMEVGSTDMLL